MHGRHFGGWVWDRVQKHLADEGWDSIAPTFDVEKGVVNLDEHATMLRQAEREKGSEHFIDVGWSWGANVVMRELGDTAVKKLIFPSGVFDKSTLPWIKSHLPKSIHPLPYSIMEANNRAGWREYGPEVLFGGIKNERIIEGAVRSLRDHPKLPDEPDVPRLPPLPMVYIKLTEDKAVRLEAQDDMANLIGVVPVPFDSGHTPMLSRPKDFAELLIALAKET